MTLGYGYHLSTNEVFPSASSTSIFWNMNDHLSNPPASVKPTCKSTAASASPMNRLMSTIVASVRCTVWETYSSPVAFIFMNSILTVLRSSLVAQASRPWGEAAPHSLIMVIGWNRRLPVACPVSASRGDVTPIVKARTRIWSACWAFVPSPWNCPVFLPVTDM